MSSRVVVGRVTRFPSLVLTVVWPSGSLAVLASFMISTSSPSWRERSGSVVDLWAWRRRAVCLPDGGVISMFSGMIGATGGWIISVYTPLGALEKILTIK